MAYSAEHNKEKYHKQRIDAEERADEGDSKARETVAKINSKLGKGDREYTDTEAVDKAALAAVEPELGTDLLAGKLGVGLGAKAISGLMKGKGAVKAGAKAAEKGAMREARQVAKSPKGKQLAKDNENYTKPEAGNSKMKSSKKSNVKFSEKGRQLSKSRNPIKEVGTGRPYYKDTMKWTRKGGKDVEAPPKPAPKAEPKPQAKKASAPKKALPKKTPKERKPATQGRTSYKNFKDETAPKAEPKKEAPKSEPKKTEAPAKPKSDGKLNTSPSKKTKKYSSKGVELAFKKKGSPISSSSSFGKGAKTSIKSSAPKREAEEPYTGAVGGKASQKYLKKVQKDEGAMGKTGKAQKGKVVGKKKASKNWRGKGTQLG